MSGEGDKTEPATPKKREEAAKRGDNLHSRDLGAAAMAAGFLIWLMLMGSTALMRSQDLLRGGLALTARDISAFEPGHVLARLCAPLVASVLSLAGLLLVMAIAPNIVLRSGFRWQAIAPRWSRLDPGAGLKRLLGTEALTGLAFALAKVSGGLALLYWFGLSIRQDVLGLGVTHGRDWTGPALAILMALLWHLGALTGIAGGVDLFLQWRRREARLRMTKQDIREETKSTEGAPERKRAMRERQYAIAARSARKAMAEATVVLTNPTHFAVALRYRPGIDGVPVVVARGTDGAAQAIRDLAEANEVPLMESPVLARAIYFTSKVGDTVVNDLYLAVATVLALLFDLDAQVLRERRAADASVPDSMRFGPDGRRET